MEVRARATRLLDKNLYWGRAFGARRYFDESAKQFRRIATEGSTGPVLEQLVYRRVIPGARWNSEKDIEQLVVLRAVHGEQIDAAVRDFYRYATEGAVVTFKEGETERRVRVHVAGYAGHNRLMDGVTLQQLVGTAGPKAKAAAALPSFVFACRSASYFSDALSDSGSNPLVMTRDLMAPEGYVIEAMARGLGDRVVAGRAPTARGRSVRALAAHSGEDRGHYFCAPFSTALIRRTPSEYRLFPNDLELAVELSHRRDVRSAAELAADHFSGGPILDRVDRDRLAVLLPEARRALRWRAPPLRT